MKRKTKWIFIALCGVALLFFFLHYFQTIFGLILISIIFSYLLFPLVDSFTDRNVPISVAVWICFGMLFSALTFVIFVVIPFAYSELQGIFDSFSVYCQYALSLWENYISDSQFAMMIRSVGLDEKVFAFFSNRTDLLIERTVGLISLIPQVALGSFLVPVIVYYFLRDKDKIAGNFLMIFPPDTRVAVTTLGNEINSVLRSFIGGNLIVSLIVGLLTFLGLWILGTEHAFVLGIFYGILDIIPYFGPFLGMIPVILLSLLQGDVNIFFVIVLLFLIQQCENYFISPRILGDQVGLHPVSVILLVLAGGYCGGIAGMVLIIPIAAVMKIILFFLYNRFVASGID